MKGSLAAKVFALADGAFWSFRIGPLVVLVGSLFVMSACDRVNSSEEVPETNEVILHDGGPPAATMGSLRDTNGYSDLAPASFGDLLAPLESYRMKVDLEFDGIEGNAMPATWHIEREVISTMDPPARRVTLISEGLDSGNLPLSYVSYVEPGLTYFFVPDLGCLGDSIGANKSSEQLFELESLLTNFEKIPLVNSGVIVNGVLSNQFHFTESELNLDAGSDLVVEGDIFLALDGSFLTRLELTAEGAEDIMGDGVVRDGAYNLRIEVNQFDEEILVQPPLECVQSFLYPVLEGAYAITSLDDLLSYKAPVSFEEAVGFYQEELAAAGWAEKEEPGIFEDLAILVYSHDGNQIIIQIAPEPNSNETNIFISP